jgi:hypothetical protein
MVANSYTASLSVWKQIALVVLVSIAIVAPTVIGRPFSNWDAEPAFLAVLFGIVVAPISYVLLRALLPDLGDRAVTSAAVVLGLISAHVYVFRAMDTTLSIPMFALFIFLFFLHFDEGLA